jgi:hypothetical protein
MEVHAHSHLASGETHTPRKKWAHYFWEFLMLFLAVFCGFLAEYQLEHKIEIDREKQFMYSMVEDLKSDTAQLNSIIAFQKRWQSQMDSLVVLLNSPDRAGVGNEIYSTAKEVSNGRRFLSNDRTLQQLKNAGNLRLVRKQIVSDNIIDYDQRLRRLLYLSEIETQMKHDNRHLAYKIFRYADVYNLRKHNAIMPVHNPSLLTSDPDLLNEFCGDVRHIQWLDGAVMINEETILKKATAIINLITDKYKLK